ncbi:hypothetical protein Lal_00006496 [Lupinus albus]|nr:hypothetical protein Lal_00006496 [Lupinus albus]
MRHGTHPPRIRSTSYERNFELILIQQPFEKLTYLEIFISTLIFNSLKHFIAYYTLPFLLYHGTEPPRIRSTSYEGNFELILIQQPFEKLTYSEIFISTLIFNSLKHFIAYYTLPFLLYHDNEYKK